MLFCIVVFCGFDCTKDNKLEEISSTKTDTALALEGKAILMEFVEFGTLILTSCSKLLSFAPMAILDSDAFQLSVDTTDVIIEFDVFMVDGQEGTAGSNLSNKDSNGKSIIGAVCREGLLEDCSALTIGAFDGLDVGCVDHL